jgi:hypothetical protein
MTYCEEVRPLADGFEHEGCWDESRGAYVARCENPAFERIDGKWLCAGVRRFTTGSPTPRGALSSA